MSGKKSPNGTASHVEAQDGKVYYLVDVRFLIHVLFVVVAVAFTCGYNSTPNGAYGNSKVTIPDRLVVDENQINPNQRNTNKTVYQFCLDGRDATANSSVTQGNRGQCGLHADDTQDPNPPVGQHLLVDMLNVDAMFLNDETRLVQALRDVAKAANVPLISSHCYSLSHKGVSCVAISVQSHISLYTWPGNGTIAFEIFTISSEPTYPLVTEIERSFGQLQQGGDKSDIVSSWSLNIRGVGENQLGKNAHINRNSDLVKYVFAPQRKILKKHIASINGRLQRIDIWDILSDEDFPTYDDGKKHNLPDAADPRWLDSQFASPERVFFLNGELQSTSLSEREFHESLVHPSMFAHPKPENVLIVGGSEGATLREVLKHKTVKKATMIEPDPLVVNVARKYLQNMNDCSDITGSEECCFDDSRTRLIHEDPKTWFLRYRDEKLAKDKKGSDLVDLFDVIILDSLYSPSGTSVVDTLYDDEMFLSSIFDLLSRDGVIVIHIRYPPNIHDQNNSPRDQLIHRLEKNQEMESMFVYESPDHSRTLTLTRTSKMPTSFLVLCKNAYSCRSRWYADADFVDYEILSRISDTKSNEPALVYYDGSTQRAFQYCPRAWETTYCRRDPVPFECMYTRLDTSKRMFELRLNSSDSDFEVRSQTKDGTIVHTMVAKADIPKGSYVMPLDMSVTFIVRDHAIKNLRETANSLYERATVIDDFIDYVDSHGYPSVVTGDITYVDLGGKVLMRSTSTDEGNVGKWFSFPSDQQRKTPPLYSPVFERRMKSMDLFLVAIKDIKVGEELVLMV